MNSKAVIFVRVSTQKQNLESQEDALRRNALSDGFTLDNILYVGKKESGYELDEDERKGLEELYELISNENIDTIYIWELSRLSRKPKVLYSVRDRLLENGIQLKCLNPQFSLLSNDRKQFDSTANIIFSLFGALAEQEIIEKKARFARGKARLASQGKFNGGAIPFGYKVDYDKDKLIVVDDDEAKIVREIYNLYENGMSQSSIAKEFYARGNKRITISFVHQILTNTLLTGVETKSEGASYARKYPPIISEGQFKRCRDLADKNNTSISKARSIYYADRLIKCSECGGYWSATGNKANYHCYDAYNINKKYNGYDGVPNCSNKSTISINVIDSLLWHISIRLEEEFILTAAQEKSDSYRERKKSILEKLNQTDNLLKGVDLKKQRLMETYIDGLDEEIYQKKKASLKKEEEAIRKDVLDYKDEIQHLDNLISNIAEGLQLKDDEAIENHIDYVLKLIEQISKITNDRTRYDIIHKHIREVTIVSSSVKYKFAHYEEEKDVFAKNIIIYPYIGKPLYYYYIPYGKTMLYCDDNNNIKGKVEMEYLDRFKDKSKKKARAKQKEARSNKNKERQEKGILTLMEASKIYHVVYSTLWAHIKKGKLKCNVEHNKKYILAKDLEEYLSLHHGLEHSNE